MPFVATSSDVPPLVPGRDFCGLVVKGSIDMLGKVKRKALIPLSLLSLVTLDVLFSCVSRW